MSEIKAYIIDRTKKVQKNKTTEILKHLKVKGHITAREAYELYGSQKVSSIIFNLRKQGYNIVTKECVGKDRYGHTCQYARYELVEDKT